MNLMNLNYQFILRAYACEVGFLGGVQSERDSLFYMCFCPYKYTDITFIVAHVSRLVKLFQ